MFWVSWFDGINDIIFADREDGALFDVVITVTGCSSLCEDDGFELSPAVCAVADVVSVTIDVPVIDAPDTVDLARVVIGSISIDVLLVVDAASGR